MALKRLASGALASFCRGVASSAPPPLRGPSDRWRSKADAFPMRPDTLASANEQHQEPFPNQPSIRLMSSSSAATGGMPTAPLQPDGGHARQCTLEGRLTRADGESASTFGHVGFIGLGAMGHHMAFNLARSGFALHLYDRSDDAVIRLLKRLEGSGGRMRPAPSPREIAECPEVTAIITMLPATDHVRDVYEGPQGILSVKGGPRARLLLDCSTMSPIYTFSLAQKVAKCRGRHLTLGPPPQFMDAPVSGGVPGAEKGTLTFMCGGNKGTLAFAKPLLGSMGTRALHMGDKPGVGQVAKLCNNLACGVEMAAVSEALALSAASGLDPKQMAQVLNSSSGRCWSSEQYCPVPGVNPDVPSSSNYEGGFSSALMLKDLQLAMELAGSCSQPVPMAQVAATLYDKVLQECKEEPRVPDFSSIYKYVYKGKTEAEIKPNPNPIDLDP